MELNNREIAVLLWLGVLLLWMLAKSEMRGSLLSLIKTFLTPAILLPTIGYFAWAAGLVFLAFMEGLWNWELASDTVIWAVASFALMFHSEQVLQGGHFLRRKAGKVLQATILVEVFINLVVFPLVVELILFPVLACLVMTTALAGSKPELKAAKGPSETLTAMIGLGLVAYVLIKLITSPDLLNGTTGLRFFLPVWLSLGVLPYFYLLALYAGYDSAFRRINFNCSDRLTRRRAKWALMRRCHFRAGRLGEFRGAWISGVIEADPDESPEELLARFAPRSDQAKAA